jgi:hypothetical protein
VVANKELVKVYVRKDLIGHDSLSSSRPKQREVCVFSQDPVHFATACV